MFAVRSHYCILCEFQASYGVDSKRFFFLLFFFLQVFQFFFFSFFSSLLSSFVESLKFHSDRRSRGFFFSLPSPAFLNVVVITIKTWIEVWQLRTKMVFNSRWRNDYCTIELFFFPKRAMWILLLRNSSSLYECEQSIRYGSRIVKII